MSARASGHIRAKINHSHLRFSFSHVARIASPERGELGRPTRTDMSCKRNTRGADYYIGKHRTYVCTRDAQRDAKGRRKESSECGRCSPPQYAPGRCPGSEASQADTRTRNFSPALPRLILFPFDAIIRPTFARACARWLCSRYFTGSLTHTRKYIKKEKKEERRMAKKKKSSEFYSERQVNFKYKLSSVGFAKIYYFTRRMLFYLEINIREIRSCLI